jgi:hypothetical protein
MTDGRYRPPLSKSSPSPWLAWQRISKWIIFVVLAGIVLPFLSYPVVLFYGAIIGVSPRQFDNEISVAVDKVDHILYKANYCKFEDMCAASTRIIGVNREIHGFVVTVHGINDPNIQQRIIEVFSETFLNTPKLSSMEIQIYDFSLNESNRDITFFSPEPKFKITLRRKT